MQRTVIFLFNFVNTPLRNFMQQTRVQLSTKIINLIIELICSMFNKGYNIKIKVQSLEYK